MAVENDVHVVGVSSLAAGHKVLIPQLVEALKKEGIHGTAVVPRVRESGEWKERIRSVAQDFQGKIEEYKEALRKL